MSLPEHLGAEQIEAIAAVLVLQLGLCQKQLDILGLRIAAAHVDRALDELSEYVPTQPWANSYHLSCSKDYSLLDRMADDLY